MTKAKSVDAYIEGLNDQQAAIVSKLRELIHQAAPDASESIKWAQPVWEDNGPCCYVKAFTHHANLGFWRGVDLRDDHGVLEGTGDKMRHVKVTSVDEIRDDVLSGLISQAVALNRSKGDRTKGP